MLTIMSSLAQEESRSISENVTWGKRRSMENGKFSLAYKRFLGYEKGEDELPKIVEEKAKIIREIYDLFLAGRTIRAIANHLTDQGIPTPAGKEKWSVSTIMSILQNEKYKGDALLQKTYTVDFLSKTIKKNNGEVPQYYIQNSHPAIIDPDTFNLVQNEIKRRHPNRRQLHRSSPFSGKLICGECGGFYGRKVWHSGSKHRSHVWRCNQKYKNEIRCTTPNLREVDIKDAFETAFNLLLGDKEQYIAHFEELLPLLADTSGLEKQLEVLESQHAERLDTLRRYMEENTRQVQDQVEYSRKFNALSGECTEIEARIKSIQAEILAQKGRKEQIRRCLDELRQCGDILEEFNPDLWNTTVESAKISVNGTLTFLFRDGTEIPVNLSKKQ